MPMKPQRSWLRVVGEAALFSVVFALLATFAFSLRVQPEAEPAAVASHD
jgi:hypothetical protein